MRVKKLENFGNKSGSTGCKCSSLNAPSTIAHVCHPLVTETLPAINTGCRFAMINGDGRRESPFGRGNQLKLFAFFSLRARGSCRGWRSSLPSSCSASASSSPTPSPASTSQFSREPAEIKRVSLHTYLLHSNSNFEYKDDQKRLAKGSVNLYCGFCM